MRTTIRQGLEETEIEYGITSVSRRQAPASSLLDWRQGHWGIENRCHYVRDVAFREDACPIRTGDAPQNLAALRNGLLSLLRLDRQSNITAALRACTWNSQRLFTWLGILKE